MEDTDRALWDRKYEEGLPSLTKPDPFFILAYERLVDRSFPNAGMALDLAAGLGRHALWLADRGWQVSAVDVSEVAIGLVPYLQVLLITTNDQSVIGESSNLWERSQSPRSARKHKAGRA
jgi:hypothetical protein